MPRQYIILIVAVAAIAIISIVVLIPKSQAPVPVTAPATVPAVDPDAGHYKPSRPGKNDFRKPGSQ